MYAIYAELRDKKGLSDYSVAKQTGVGRSTLSDWKTGKHTPNQENLKKLCEFFGVTLDYLISGHDADYTVTPFEYMIISAYRELSQDKKETILDILHINMDVAEEDAFTA